MASGYTASLSVQNNTISDSALLVDDFRITEYAQYRVVTNTSDSGPGSLREAITGPASPADRYITFDPSLSGQTINVPTEIRLQLIDNTITIDASNLPKGITLRGTGQQRILHFWTSISQSFDPPPLRLINLTFTGGVGSQDGTTIGTGGAVLLDGVGTCYLQSCTFYGNRSGERGGALTGRGTFTILDGCTFYNNEAAKGGAVFAWRLYSWNSTFSNNSSYANQPADTGAAIACSYCVLVNNTFAYNLGGQVIAQLRSDEPYVVKLTNCLITGVESVAGVISGRFTTDHCILSTDAESIIGRNRLEDNGGPTKTVLLAAGSPALDAGTSDFLFEYDGGRNFGLNMSKDQRGLDRTKESNGDGVAAPDIGAFEQQSPRLSLGFNFIGNGGPSGTLATSDMAGESASAQSNWNNLGTDWDGASNGTAPNAPALRRDSGGNTVAGLRLWWDAPSVWSGNPAFGGSLNNAKLMFGYLDSDGSGDGSSATDLYSTTTAQPFFSIAGLPPALTQGGYRVLVYTDGDAAAGRIASYWLASNQGANPANVSGENRLTPSVFVSDTDNYVNVFTRGTGTSIATATAGANYVQFDALTEPAFTVRAEEHSFRAPINAVQIIRNELITVTTAEDELDPYGFIGTGRSLREAVRDAPDGAGIVFAPTLDGKYITFNNAFGEIVLNKSVTIDASALPHGVKIARSLGSTGRHFTVSFGKAVALVRLSLEGGNLPDVNGIGGSIKNDGTLSMTQCTFFSNFARFGGALSSAGTATLRQCTLWNNRSNGNGGAIDGGGSLVLTQCTLTNNTSSGGGGGAISNFQGQLSLMHCTLYQNSGFTQGRAIRNSEGTVTLTNNIIAGNTTTGATNTDIYNTSSDASDPAIVTRVGANIIGVHTNAGTHASDSGPAAISTSNPGLGGLEDNGGPTLTRIPVAGSPAINAALGSLYTTDQRGFATISTPDIGATDRAYTLVTSNMDSGAGSLRSVIAECATLSGADTVTFAPELSGRTITFAQGAGFIQVDDSSPLTVDASALPAGIRLSGGGTK